MKKSTIFTVLCAFLLINTINAQDMKFGVKGSFLMSTIASPDDGFSKLKPGYSAGVYFQYNVLDILGVSFEPVYSLKGANDIDALYIYDEYSPKLWNPVLNEPIEYEQHNLSLTTFELPVLIQLNLDFGGAVMRLFVGPSWDIIHAANFESIRKEPSAGDDFVNDIETNVDVTDRFLYNDYSGVAGVGFDIEMDPVDLRIDFKYHHGFTNINNVENKPAIYNRSFGVTVGVGLNKLILK